MKVPAHLTPPQRIPTHFVTLSSFLFVHLYHVISYNLTDYWPNQWSLFSSYHLPSFAKMQFYKDLASFCSDESQVPRMIARTQQVLKGLLSERVRKGASEWVSAWVNSWTSSICWALTGPATIAGTPCRPAQDILRKVLREGGSLKLSHCKQWEWPGCNSPQPLPGLANKLIYFYCSWLLLCYVVKLKSSQSPT